MFGAIFESISSAVSPSMNLFWTSWRVNSFDKQECVISDLSAAASILEIWREHNNRIFNRLTRSPEQPFICAFPLFLIGAISLLVGQGKGLGGGWSVSIGDEMWQPFEGLLGRGRMSILIACDLCDRGALMVWIFRILVGFFFSFCLYWCFSLTLHLHMHLFWEHFVSDVSFELFSLKAFWWSAGNLLGSPFFYKKNYIILCRLSKN